MALPRARPPRDVLTATAVVTAVRDDKPVTTLATSITNQDDVLVVDGTAVVWRDPAVGAATPPITHPHAGSPAPTQEKIA